MRWLVVMAVLVAACFAPKRYAVDRPGLECDRALRVARRTMDALGYTITEMVEPRGPGVPGLVAGTKQMPDGRTTTGRVRISCGPNGAQLQPVEDAIVPNFEFSRAFGYSFTTLVQRPDVETPMADAGVQVLVEQIDVYEQRLDLGGEAMAAGNVLMRVTIRNGTDRAVAVEAAGVVLSTADGSPTPPLAKSVAGGALAGPAGESVRPRLLDRLEVAPRTTAVRFAVYPAGAYREARVSLEDVETGERDGIVTAVE